MISRPLLILLALLGTALFSLGGEVERLDDIPYLEEGRTETLDLYLPPTPSGKPRPAVLWIHGGGWQGGTKRNRPVEESCRDLAQAGYVVASIDYALATTERHTWPLAVLDGKNGVRFLRANAAKYNIDPKRIAVMGGSAGGHLALMVAFTHGDPALTPQAPYPGIDDRVGAVANFYGITNLLTRQRVTPEGVPTGEFHPGSNLKFTGLRRAEGEAVWRAASPVTHVKPGLPPVFITHGKRDATVDYLQATELAAALEKAGVPHELQLLEQAGHSYTLTQWKGEPLERDLRPVLLDFLQKHLRP